MEHRTHEELDLRPASAAGGPESQAEAVAQGGLHTTDDVAEFSFALATDVITGALPLGEVRGAIAGLNGGCRALEIGQKRGRVINPNSKRTTQREERKPPKKG